jgi:UDP-glucose 4-epimerase
LDQGVLGAYLSAELLKKKEKVVVTTRSLKKIYKNYDYLKIQKKVIFEKLNINEKIQVDKIISKYNPKKIFYFAWSKLYN